MGPPRLLWRLPWLSHFGSNPCSRRTSPCSRRSYSACRTDAWRFEDTFMCSSSHVLFAPSCSPSSCSPSFLVLSGSLLPHAFLLVFILLLVLLVLSCSFCFICSLCSRSSTIFDPSCFLSSLLLMFSFLCSRALCSLMLFFLSSSFC